MSIHSRLHMCRFRNVHLCHGACNPVPGTYRVQGDWVQGRLFFFFFYSSKMVVDANFERLRLSGIGDHQTWGASVSLITLVWDIILCVLLRRCQCWGVHNRWVVAALMDGWYFHDNSAAESTWANWGCTNLFISVFVFEHQGVSQAPWFSSPALFVVKMDWCMLGW